jgi:hypothetical protein
LGRIGWSEDGRTLQLEIEKIPDGGGRLVQRVLQFNPMTGAYTDVIGPVPSYKPRAIEIDVKLEPEMKVLEAPLESRPIYSWWLASTTESEQPKAVVSEHAFGAVLPAGEKFVAYVTNGTLYTRQVIELSLDQYKQMREAALRTETLSRAKQIGLAYALYAADHDDTLGPDFKVSDLEVYLKNGSMLTGFTMVWQGGNFNDVKDPANTVLGYVDGNGGRAVIYLDSHVKWEKTGG